MKKNKEKYESKLLKRLGVTVAGTVSYMTVTEHDGTVTEYKGPGRAITYDPDLLDDAVISKGLSYGVKLDRMIEIKDLATCSFEFKDFVDAEIKVETLKTKVRR